MTDPQLRLALGLMSGTSLDGMDAALILSDGRVAVETGASMSLPYDAEFRARLRAVRGGGVEIAAEGGKGEVAAVEHELTLRHAGLVKDLLAKAGRQPQDVAVIGFHGHTILHEPDLHKTWQIGDGALLAAETGIDVVCDLRAQDVAWGGQGAPLAPLYHAALAVGLDKPLAVLNLGGVGNLTWIGQGGGEILAFDTGPGNALIDDWVSQRTDQTRDEGGALALSGQVDEKVLAKLLENNYFAETPPKSLDRDAFDVAPLAGLNLADGAATLTAFTAEAVAAALPHLPSPPGRWLVCGGGRHNPAIMAALTARLGVPVDPVEAVSWDGDALEAQAFAYLALRSLDGLALSVPGTTGVEAPTTGGVLHRAAPSG